VDIFRERVFLRSEEQGSRIIPLLQLKEEMERLGDILPTPETRPRPPAPPPLPEPAVVGPPPSPNGAPRPDGPPRRRRRRRRGGGGGDTGPAPRAEP
jgi:hypothetical protein